MGLDDWFWKLQKRGKAHILLPTFQHQQFRSLIISALSTKGSLTPTFNCIKKKKICGCYSINSQWEQRNWCPLRFQSPSSSSHPITHWSPSSSTLCCTKKKKKTFLDTSQVFLALRASNVNNLHAHILDGAIRKREPFPARPIAS